jgi:tetratricopeptide (TPR) repeat protein
MDLYEDALVKRSERCEEEGREGDESCEGIAAAYHGQGLIYARQDKGEEAIDKFKDAVNESSWNSKYRHQLGYQYLQQGSYDAAVREINTALYYDPNNLTPYLDIAAAYLHRGEPGDLNEAYKRQKQLIEKMEDEKVTSLTQNQGPWWDRIDPDLEACEQAEIMEIDGQQAESTRPDGVIFDNEPMKKSFSYYQAALTAFLREEQGEARNYERDKAEEHVNKARDMQLNSEDESTVKCLLSSNIESLKEDQKSFQGTLDEFSRRFL